MEHWIFDLDRYLLELIGGSGITILFIAKMISWIVKKTPWTGDDWLQTIGEDVKKLLGTFNVK